MDLGDRVSGFIKDNGVCMIATIMALNGRTSPYEVSGQELDDFLMDCLTEGYAVMRERALQILEAEKVEE